MSWSVKKMFYVCFYIIYLPSKVDHPCGARLLAALPTDAEPGTKIYISVPAASSPFPPLVAVKAESIVGNTVGGIKVSSSTALKVLG
jgi:hypothetical protein